MQLAIHDSPYCSDADSLQLPVSNRARLARALGWEFASVLGSAILLLASPGWELRWILNELALGAEASRRLVRTAAARLNAAFLVSSVFALSAAVTVTSATALSRASANRL